MRVVRRSRWKVVAAASGAAILLIAACSPTRTAPVNAPPVAAVVQPTVPAGHAAAVAPASDAVRVEVRDFRFSAATLTLPVGTTVTWTNRDAEPHTVTADDKAFASKALDTDESFAFTFDQSGTYAYHCTLHPYMTATVVAK